MANPARSKGTSWEVELLPLLRSVFGEHVERSPLKGTADDGDFTGCDGLLVEAKKTDVPHFLQWAKTAAKKRPDGDWRIVWSGDRRKGDGPYVLLPLGEWAYLEFLGRILGPEEDS